MSAVEVLADGRMRFYGEGDFQALDAAHEWCRQNGVSYGSLQRGDPVGLMVGDYAISKWRNLSAKDRAALDGVLTGDKRYGPVFIQMTPAALASVGGWEVNRLLIDPSATAAKLVADYAKTDPIADLETNEGLVGLQSDNTDIEVSESAFYPLTRDEEAEQVNLRG